MEALSLIQALGSSGMFASRMFAPAFLTAVVLRFAEHLPLLNSMGLLAGRSTTPTWFTSDIGLVILGVLTVAELVADKVPELREAAEWVQPYLKPALAAATALGVVAATDQQFALAAVHQAGVFSHPGPLVALVATIGTTRLRGAFVGWLQDADPGDTLHLRRLFSWAEDAWVLIGIVLLFVLPALLMLVVAGVAAVLAVARHRLVLREEARRVPCPTCGEAIYACAPVCSSCHAQNPSPRAIGALGQSLPDATGDPDLHAFRLLAHLRCPACATRVKRAQIGQSCPACGRPVFADAAAGQRYLAILDRRAPRVLAVVLVVSLVPLVGFVAGALYSELALVAPLRVHLPLGSRWLLKWLLRALRWLVLVVQVVPGLNGVVAAGEAFLRYRAYRRALAGRLAGQVGLGPERAL